VITCVCISGKILGEDYNPHNQSFLGFGLPGCIMCLHSNPNISSKTSPLHHISNLYPVKSVR